MGGSAAWLLQRTGKNSVQNRLAGAIVIAPSGLPELPQNLSGILGQLYREEHTGLDHKAVAATIVAIRTADAVIAGPFSAEDANTPGMIAHWRTSPVGRIARCVRPGNLLCTRAFPRSAPVPVHPDEPPRGPDAGGRGHRHRHSAERLRQLQGEVENSRSRSSAAMGCSGQRIAGRKSNRSAVKRWTRPEQERRSALPGSWHVGSSRLQRRELFRTHVLPR